MHNLNPKNVIPLHRNNRAAGLGPVPMSSGGTIVTPALVPFARWQKARDRAIAALLAGETRLLVTGPAGTGKTVLLEQAARVLRAAGWAVTTQLAAGEPTRPESDGPAALLVDEADRLSRDELDHLLRSTTGPILLAGLDSLASRLADATRITLGLLDIEECRDYVAKWLTAAGRAPSHLDTAAMQRVVILSGGVPRLLASLLGAASWLADSTDAPVIEVQHIEEAAELRACFSAEDAAQAAAEDPAAAPQARRSRLLVPALASMLVLAVGGFALSRAYPDEVSRLLDPAITTLAGLRTEIAAKVTASTPPTPAPAAPRVAAAPPAAPVVLKPEPQVTERVPEPAPAAAKVAIAPVAAVEAVAAPSVELPAPAKPELNLPPAPVGDLAIPAAPVEQIAPAPVVTAPVVTAPVVTAPVVAAPVAAPPIVAPPPVESIVTAAITPPPAIPAQVARPTLPGATLDLLLRRGREMAAIGDISAARLLFTRVAETGNTEGMVALGRSYDPVSLGNTAALLTPDPAEAARWYRRAADLGSDEARALLAGLAQAGRR